MCYFWEILGFFCEIDFFLARSSKNTPKSQIWPKRAQKHEKLVSGSSRSIRCTRHDVGDVSCMTRPCSILILIIRCRKYIYFDFCQVRFRSKPSSFSRKRARSRSKTSSFSRKRTKTSSFSRKRAKTSSFSIENELVFDPIDAKPNHPKIKSYELLSIEINAS